MSESITINGRTFPIVNGEATRSLRELPHQPSASAKPRPNKYGNRHVIIGSEHFDSEKEGRRHLVLVDRQRKGEITDLKRQVTFKLMVNGQKVGSVRPDWTYLEAGKLIADDAKGYQTRDHKTRWKLAKALHPEIEWRLS